MQIDPELIIADFTWLEETIPKNRKYPFFLDATRSGKVSNNEHVQTMNFETFPEFIQRFKIEWSRPLIEVWQKLDKVS